MVSWKDLIVAAEQSYASCYCEENVYQLTQRLFLYKETHPEEMEGVEFYVLFISNRNKQTPIWFQRAAAIPGEAVVWDYHVILCSKSKRADETLVFDLDTLLQFPCPAGEYFQNSFKPDLSIFNKYRQ
jgi:hypothetical protein